MPQVLPVSDTLSDTDLAAEIERLRLDLERPGAPPLPDGEVRRRVDRIADLMLARFGSGVDARSETAAAS